MRQFPQDKAGHGVAGMFHQLNGGDPEPLARNLVGPAHLISRQYLHLQAS